MLSRIMPIFMDAGGGYAWDPAKKSASIALSLSNTVATYAAGGTYRNVLGTSVGATFEVVIGTSISDASIGIATAAQALDGTFIGDSAPSAGWYQDGRVFINGSEDASLTNYAAGDVLKVNYGATNVTFFKNGVSQGTYAHGLTGSIYPAATQFRAGTQFTIQNYA